MKNLEAAQKILIRTNDDVGNHPHGNASFITVADGAERQQIMNHASADVVVVDIGNMHAGHRHIRKWQHDNGHTNDNLADIRKRKTHSNQLCRCEHGLPHMNNVTVNFDLFFGRNQLPQCLQP